MSFETQEFDRFGCPSFEIAAYIDGELDPAREIEIESHFAACPECTDELNHQKQFLCDLNSALTRENEIELPNDFAKTIVTNAESSVSGLRRPRERYNAVFICAAMFFFGLFALGAESGSAVEQVTDALEKVAAMAGFFGHIVYSFLLGIGFVMRTLSEQVRIPDIIYVLSVVIFSVIMVSLSRRWIRFRRT